MVLGILGVVAAVVMVAINPAKQLQDAREAERAVHARQLTKAMNQYLIGEWQMPGGDALPTGEENAKPVCSYGVTGSVDCVSLDALVPDYITAIPRDSAEPNPNHTGYMAFKDAAGRPEVMSTAPLQEELPDPLLVSTTIANVVNYPEQNNKLPAGGVWAIKSTADVPDAATLNNLFFEYSTDYAGNEGAATWTVIASLSGQGDTVTDNGDGTYQYVGDDVAIPSGLTAVRARSVGADADELTFVVAVSSATPNRVAHESFASPDGTVLDTSYLLDSGQHISGYNRGAQTLGGEMAGRTGMDTSWGQSWWVGVGSQNQLVKGLYSFNGTSGSGDEDGGNSILLRTPNYYNHVRARMAGAGGIALNEQGGSTVSAVYSFDTSQSYHVEAQAAGRTAVMSVYDSSGATLLVRVGLFGHTKTATAVGVSLRQTTGPTWDDWEAYTW